MQIFVFVWAWEEGLLGVGWGLGNLFHISWEKSGFLVFFHFPGVKIPTMADLKLPTENGSGQEIDVIHILEPEGVLSSCCWMN